MDKIPKWTQWLLVSSLVFGVVTCDTRANIEIAPVLFYSAQIVTAYPVTDDGAGGYLPVCSQEEGQTITGVRLHVNLLSTGFDPELEPTDPDKEHDSSIKADDIIDIYRVQEIDFSAGSNVDVTLDCLKSSDGDTHKASCDGTSVTNPTGNAESMAYTEYQDRYEAFDEGIGLVILIDQSGSMRGYVEPDGYKEVPYTDAMNYITGMDIASIATDKNNFRILTVEKLLRQLNKNDKVLVLSYNGDDGVELVCKHPTMAEPGYEDCYVKASRITSETGNWLLSDTATGQLGALAELKGYEGGMTPLWEAVDTAWDFLLTQKNEVKHIVVIGDGPDTCNPESENFLPGYSSCSATKFSDVKNKVTTAMNMNGGKSPIHVNFVQIQAPGYMDRDLRQQEIACWTGGQYVFINSESFQKSTGFELQDSLSDSVDKIRYSFTGFWTVDVSVPNFEVDLPLPSGTPLGDAYLLSGTLKLSPNDKYITAEKFFKFGIGDQQTGVSSTQNTPNLDNRVYVRKACYVEANCGEPEGLECQYTCSRETKVCLGEPFFLLDGMSCTAGVCCSGTCEAVAECP